MERAFSFISPLHHSLRIPYYFLATKRSKSKIQSEKQHFQMAYIVFLSHQSKLKKGNHSYFVIVATPYCLMLNVYCSTANVFLFGLHSFDREKPVDIKNLHGIVFVSITFFFCFVFCFVLIFSFLSLSHLSISDCDFIISTSIEHFHSIGFPPLTLCDAFFIRIFYVK